MSSKHIVLLSQNILLVTLEKQKKDSSTLDKKVRQKLLRNNQTF